MTAYCFIIQPHAEISVVWAKDIQDAIELVKAKMSEDQYAQVCSFGGTDKVEIGKRAVN